MSSLRLGAMKSSFDYSEFFLRNDKIMTNSVRAAFPLLLPFPSGFAEAHKTACHWIRVRVRVTVNHYRQEEIR